MTLCPTNRTSRSVIKDAGHWLGLAISLAYVLGLNRDIDCQPHNPRRKHLERRIWWIAFIRDRTLSLRSSFGSPRLVHIRKEDSYIDILSLEDFELVENSAKYEGIDELRMKIIAVDCVEKAMMCWYGSEDEISKGSINSLRISPISQLSYQNPSRFSSRSISEHSDDFLEVGFSKDKQHVPPSTYSQESNPSDQDRMQKFLENGIDKQNLFMSPSRDVVISEYDDYFEYLQNSMEENNVDKPYLACSDDLSSESEAFAIGFNYEDEILSRI